MNANRRPLFLTLVILGLLLRASFVLLAGNQRPTYLSGGSDAPAYILLASNLLDHKGFSYAGQPSAFRPPGYPLFVAGTMAVFGKNYLLALRCLQFFLGLLTVVLCAKAALLLFGPRAAYATLVVTLFLPTLIFSTAQVLTECLSAFLTAIFLVFLVSEYRSGGARAAVGLGVATGLLSLVRFNAAAMPLFGALSVFGNRAKGPLWLRVAIILAVCPLVALPWFIRNEVVFHGAVLYSTHSGANAVQGVVCSQGRTQPGDTLKLEEAMGWNISQLETNDSSRLSLLSEVELNRHALSVAWHLWQKERWNALALLAEKTADFWLSTDQLMDTKSFPLAERLLRAAGVLSYWVVLVLAGAGFLELHRAHPQIASLFIVYAVGYTILHFPFVMNTRLRIPLMDPLVVILAGEGLLRFAALLYQLRPKAALKPVRHATA